MTSEERRLRRFSEEFKREQVKLIEAEELTIAEVSRLYEVKRDSVRRWLKNYGVLALPQQFVIQKPEEVNRIKDLEAEVRQLRQIIGQLHVEIYYKNELISLAKEKLGADFEKKTKP